MKTHYIQKLLGFTDMMKTEPGFAHEKKIAGQGE
jgi:hypothetical protein